VLPRLNSFESWADQLVGLHHHPDSAKPSGYRPHPQALLPG
jgi:hypothetical protein